MKISTDVLPVALCAPSCFSLQVNLFCLVVVFDFLFLLFNLHGKVSSASVLRNYRTYVATEFSVPTGVIR